MTTGMCAIAGSALMRRQDHVEQDDVGPLGRDLRQRLEPVGGRVDRVILVLEPLGQQLDVQRNVIDDKNAGRHTDGLLGWRPSLRDARCCA